MSEPHVLTRTEGAVGVMTFNRPKTMNTLDIPMVLAMEEALNQLEADPAVRVLVITGCDERTFVAGGNIADLNSRRGLAHYQDFAVVLHRVFRRFEESAKPTIAAVNGWALGGGAEFLLTTDLRLMADDARLGLPEIKLGLFPGGGGSQRLMRQIPLCHAKMLMFTGDFLSAAEAVAMEPALSCLGAVHSPSTGIVDSHGLMLALQGDLENAGGLVACHSGVRRVEVRGDGLLVESEDGTRLLARTVVNAAGLHACALAARTQGLAPAHVPRAHFAKGNYFTLSGKAPFSHLIYPVPEAAGLGVHLTLDLGGQAKFGPDVQWVDSADDLVVDPRRGDAFYAEVRKYWPALPDGALVPGYAGIRPKIHGPGEPAPDFCIQGPQDHGIAGLVNLFGIESPGLTSSLAIAEHVAELLGQGA